MCPLSCGELRGRQRADERKERESTWHVSYVQRVDAFTICTWLTCVCVCVCRGCMGRVCIFLDLGVWRVMCCVGGGLTVDAMANLASRWFWSRWLVTEMRGWCLHVSGISCAKSELKKGDPVLEWKYKGSVPEIVQERAGAWTHTCHSSVAYIRSDTVTQKAWKSLKISSGYKYAWQLWLRAPSTAHYQYSCSKFAYWYLLLPQRVSEPHIYLFTIDIWLAFFLFRLGEVLMELIM